MKSFYTDFEDFKNDKLCNAWVATAIVGSAVVGAGASLYSSSKAAETQAEASRSAAAAQVAAADKSAAAQIRAAQIANERIQQQFETTRSDLAPYRGIGQTAVDQLTGRLVDLTTGVPLPDLPKEMTQEELEKTPGYQFTKTQGLKAVQNAAAARGLGVSGAALKGAATFATGLADTTYNTRFEQEQALYKNRAEQYERQRAQKADAFSRLKGLVDTGEGAAAQTGVIGTKAASDIASNIVGAGKGEATAATQAGQAIASGDINAANAIAAGINTGAGAVAKAAGDIGGYFAYKGLYGDRDPTAISGTSLNA